MNRVVDVGQIDETPRLDLGERLSDAYVDWSLFLSGYAPLLVIFAIRMGPKHPGYSFWSVSFGLIFAANLFGLLNRRTAPRSFSVASVEGGASELSAYIATYILPFLVVSDVGHFDLIAYASLLLVIGVVMTQENALHVNPLLGLLRFRLTTIVTEDGQRYYIVHSGRIYPNTVVSVVQVRGHLYLRR